MEEKFWSCSLFKCCIYICLSGEHVHIQTFTDCLGAFVCVFLKKIKIKIEEEETTSNKNEFRKLMIYCLNKICAHIQQKQSI